MAQNVKPFVDYYKVLEIDRTATEQEIKVAYRRLMLENHPDRTKNPEARARVYQINEAYAALGEADTRADYDRVWDSVRVDDLREGVRRGGQESPFSHTRGSGPLNKETEQAWTNFQGKYTDWFDEATRRNKDYFDDLFVKTRDEFANMFGIPFNTISPEQQRQYAEQREQRESARQEAKREEQVKAEKQAETRRERALDSTVRLTETDLYFVEGVARLINKPLLGEVTINDKEGHKIWEIRRDAPDVYPPQIKFERTLSDLYPEGKRVFDASYVGKDRERKVKDGELFSRDTLRSLEGVSGNRIPRNWESHYRDLVWLAEAVANEKTFYRTAEIQQMSTTTAEYANRNKSILGPSMEVRVRDIRKSCDETRFSRGNEPREGVPPVK